MQGGFGAAAAKAAEGPAPGTEAAAAIGRITEQTVAEGLRLLLEYKHGKSLLEQRIINNEEWYRLRHSRAQEAGPFDPHSAWLLNSLIN